MHRQRQPRTRRQSFARSGAHGAAHAHECTLEEAVMALKPRDAYLRLHTNLDAARLYPTSRLVSNIPGMPIPRNKAVIGENAFAHESGIHQHGMLRHHSTYEIMRP